MKDVVARCGRLPVSGRQAGESGGGGVRVRALPGRSAPPGPWALPLLGPAPPGLCPHSGGPNVSSRNSSICSVSVLASPSQSRMGSWEPGAKSFSTSGDLWARGRAGGGWQRSARPGSRGRAHLRVSTVVSVKGTPLRSRTMKSLWQEGQWPTLSPSSLAWSGGHGAARAGGTPRTPVASCCPGLLRSQAQPRQVASEGP